MKMKKKNKQILLQNTFVTERNKRNKIAKDKKKKIVKTCMNGDCFPTGNVDYLLL